MVENRRNQPMAVVRLIPVLAILLPGCLGQDYLSSPAGVGPEDSGSLVRIEPGEEFEVTLSGNGAFPDEPWQIVELNPAVIELVWSDHETAVRTPGDWDAREDPDTPKPGNFIPMTHLGLTGMALGESQLALEVRVDGQRVDLYEVTVAVVQDACDVSEHAYGVMTAGRCDR